ncbi:uncharacterized protein LOC123531962 [Mercenaria mercenaria]|uniref:uncharacterized protein LOC123531962 n=1 Tax=Mercenaria mercenaria TaxID=6596 RepID=UPI00234F927C|nr:uncharacterized protein LOC123531962 [Mercenaria mercenaria]XP_045169218.2 uncharacterized protein LOC123531962 [Mercenaria mercenaria]
MTGTAGNNHCWKIFRKIQAKSIEVDDLGKAKSFQICSLQRPHMRAFHTSWFCFFIAFTAWFGIQPLIPTIRKELGLSKKEVARSGIASISATIIVRIAVGPLCDKFGPKRVMSGLLIGGAIPLAFSGLIRDGLGLIIVRLCIGVLGGAFIPCQFWTSAMFNVKIVGTANALVGGWGNLGGGFTFIIMTALFELVQLCGADEFLAWKIALVIPAVVVIGFGILILWTSDDCPQGNWLLKKLPEKDSFNKQRAKNVDSSCEDDESDTEDGCEEHWVWNHIWLIITIAVLVIQYGLCFGVEIAVNTVMNLYFLYKFEKDGCTEGLQDVVQTNITTNMISTTTIAPSDDPNPCSILSQDTASLIASLFGLMNLCARALGGIFSDFFRKHLQIPGRLLAHVICMTAEGVFLIIFSQMETIPIAIITMVAFSLFVQMSEGSTFAIVPYIYPRRVGIVAGFVGAGGNAGALIWNTIWLNLVDTDPSRWFLLLGIFVLCGNVLTLLIQVQRTRIWNVFESCSYHKRGMIQN